MDIVIIWLFFLGTAIFFYVLGRWMESSKAKGQNVGGEIGAVVGGVSGSSHSKLSSWFTGDGDSGDSGGDGGGGGGD